MLNKITTPILSVLLPLLIGLGQPSIAQAESSSGALLAAAGLPNPQAAPLSNEQQIEELSAQTGLPVAALKRMPDLVQFLIANELGPIIQQYGQKIVLAKYGIPMLILNGQRVSWPYIKKHIPTDNSGRMVNFVYSEKGIVKDEGDLAPGAGRPPSTPSAPGGSQIPDINDILNPPQAPEAVGRAGLVKWWQQHLQEAHDASAQSGNLDACGVVARTRNLLVNLFQENEPETHIDAATGKEVFDPALKDEVLVYLENLFEIPEGFSLASAQKAMTAARDRVNGLVAGVDVPDSCTDQIFDIHVVLMNGYHLAEVAHQMGWIDNAHPGETAVDLTKPVLGPEVSQGWLDQQTRCALIQAKLQQLNKEFPYASNLEYNFTTNEVIALFKGLHEVFGVPEPIISQNSAGEPLISVNYYQEDLWKKFRKVSLPYHTDKWTNTFCEKDAQDIFTLMQNLTAQAARIGILKKAPK